MATVKARKSKGKFKDEQSKRPPQSPTQPMPRALRAFIDVAGQFIQHWGFKRVQGEIWGLVFLSKSPLTATEIARQLKVSKALVSLAMSELLEYRVLFLAAGSDGREQKLIPNENLGEAIGGVLRLREKRILEETNIALDGMRNLPNDEIQSFEISPQRIDKLKELVQGSQQMLSTILEGIES